MGNKLLDKNSNNNSIFSVNLLALNLNSRRLWLKLISIQTQNIH